MLNFVSSGQPRIARRAFAAAFLALPLVAGAAFGQSAATPSSADASRSSPASQAERKLLADQQHVGFPKFNIATIPGEPLDTFARFFAWEQIALDTSLIDHTPPASGENYTSGQNPGPPRSSRALAIVHIAMFEAVNAVFHEFRSYTGLAPVSRQTSVDMAIARAAHDALVYTFPSQQSRLDKLLAFDSRFIKPDAASEALGKAAAASIIALRRGDGSQLPDPVVGVNFALHWGPGFWTPDPIGGSNVALGAHWAQVKPFVIENALQYRPPPPPRLDSQEWYDNYNLLVALGGDPAHGTPTKRTPDQTIRGIFWTFDADPLIGPPPRIFNQVARALVIQRGLPSVSQAARLFALLNVAMADTTIVVWEAKWYYQVWRPVTAIRFTGLPANSPIRPDPTFYPLGAQATNTLNPNFSPPFPGYPSGHASYAGVTYKILRAFFPDNQPFYVVSDEYNGRNMDNNGNIRPFIRQTFKSFAELEHDVLESRVWIGVHWQFDEDQGDAVGRKVTDFTLAHAFQPVSDTRLTDEK